MSISPIWLVWPPTGVPAVKGRRLLRIEPRTPPEPQTPEVDRITFHTEALELSVRNLQAALGVIADNLHAFDASVNRTAVSDTASSRAHR
jgi:hypothetical protein